ncbi:MAG: hypothetical protein JNK82_14940 [Myxococcaceae bacterium]|nr:hypothetical protein [Myxococcaceae bacterium]
MRRHLALSFLVAACLCCGPAPEPVTATATTFSVGRAGGTLTVPQGDILEGVIIEVPEGALDETVTLSVAPSEDDTPLPADGVRVGPQLTLSPADLKLNKPLRITFPFAPDEWRLFATPADKCRVWQRTDEGWQAHLAVAAGEDTLTIETTSTRAAAPGVQRAVRVSTCIMFPHLCALPGVCNSPTGFCLEKLPDLSPDPAAASTMSFMRGRLIYQNKVDATTQTLVEHAYPNGPAVQSAPITFPAFVFATGLASTADGALWGGFFTSGNAKLPRTGLPTRFETTTGTRGNGMLPVTTTTNEVTRIATQEAPSGANRRQCLVVTSSGTRTLPGTTRGFNCFVARRPTFAESLIVRGDDGLSFITPTSGSIDQLGVRAPAGFFVSDVATSYRSQAFAVTFRNADFTDFRLHLYANETAVPVSFSFDSPASDIEFGEDDRLYLTRLASPELHVYDRATQSEQIFALSTDPATAQRMRPLRVFNPRLENEMLIVVTGVQNREELYTFKRAP